MKIPSLIIVLVFIILILPDKAKSQCPSGTIEFMNQADIDNFGASYPECTELNGVIIITRAIGVTNLNGLSNLRKINGNLLIANTNLTDLTGLTNLQEISGELYIGSNTWLTSISGLNSLKHTGFLRLYNNPLLSSLSALAALETISNNLEISSCHSIVNLNGLNNLSSIGHDLLLHYNLNLNSLQGLSKLSVIGHLLGITLCHLLHDLDGLQFLHTISAIDINSCSQIENLHGLEQLEILNNTLYLWNNPFLANIDALSNAEFITPQWLVIEDNPNLTYCSIESICNAIRYPFELVRISNNGLFCTSKEELVNHCPAPQSSKHQREAFPSISVNPFTYDIEIRSLDPTLQLLEITLLDISGKILQSIEITDRTRFNLSKYPAGIYFVTLRSGRSLKSEIIFKI